MVARLTIGKKQYKPVEEQMKVVLLRSEELRSELTRAVEEDAVAFFEVLEAFMLPKDTRENQTKRREAILTSTLGAARVPLEVSRRAVEVMQLTTEVIENGNINAITDGATGAALARSALTGAGYNIRINLKDLKNHPAAEPMLAELRQLENRAAGLDTQIQSILAKRAGISAQ